MRPLTHGIVFAFITVSGVFSAAYCPDDYTNVFGDKCYKMAEDQMDWSKARAFCQQDGGDLVSIHSSEENAAIQDALPGCCSYWIGLRCYRGSDPAWSDGTTLDYANNDEIYMCKQSQAYTIVKTDGKWVIEDQSNPSLFVICQVGGVVINTTPTPTTTRATTTITLAPFTGGSECGLDYELLPDGTCVKISTNHTTWSIAEFACQQDGAHLASIHNKRSNDFIRRLALSRRITNAIFIGFQLQNETLIWQDDSALDYTNFDQGMPNQIFGACGALLTGSLQGEWTSIFCDDSNFLPYACTKPQPCPANNTFTVSGDFSSPEYPSSRSSGLYCEYFVAASPGSLVLLRFSEFQLVDGDQVILYDGEGDSEPLAVITSAAPSDRFMTKNLGVMRVVHLTGNGVGVRKWHANFVSF